MEAADICTLSVATSHIEGKFLNPYVGATLLLKLHHPNCCSRMYYSNTFQQNRLFASPFLYSRHSSGTGAKGRTATHRVLALGDKALNPFCLRTSLRQKRKTGTLRSDLDSDIIHAKLFRQVRCDVHSLFERFRISLGYMDNYTAHSLCLSNAQKGQQ